MANSCIMLRMEPPSVMLLLRTPDPVALGYDVTQLNTLHVAFAAAW